MVSQLTLVTTSLVTGSANSFTFNSNGGTLAFTAEGSASYTLWNTNTGANTGTSLTPSIGTSGVRLLAGDDELITAQNLSGGNESVVKSGFSGSTSTYNVTNSTRWTNTDASGNYLYAYNDTIMYRVNMANGSVGTLGTNQASGHARNPYVSADGSTLVFDNINSGGDVLGVYTKNLTSGQVSAVYDGGGAAVDWAAADISSTGRYVLLYRTDASAEAVNTVHRYDTQTGYSMLASLSSGGTIGDVTKADMSGDGRFVAFSSANGSVVAGDTNGTTDVFVKDLSTGNIARVSVTSGGAQSSGSVLSFDLSEDGKYLSFVSTDASLTSTSGGISSGSNGSLYVGLNPYFGTPEGDYDIGDPNVNEIIGNPGGNDTIDGGDGTDSVSTGGGGNTVNTGGGNDVVSGGGGGAPSFSGAFGRTVTPGDTVFGGNGNDTIYGSAGDDFINGQQGNDQIFGNDGYDTLRGGKDFDFINGNLGDDQVFGDLSDDTVRGGKGNDTIRGGKDNDQVYGDFDNDILYGDTGNDAVRGGKGNDAMHGNDGNDTLYGDQGNDLMWGEAGADTFAFSNTSGVDIIQDFESIDKLRILPTVNGTDIVSFANIAAHLSGTSGGVILDLGMGNTITIFGQSTGSLTANNFEFF